MELRGGLLPQVQSYFSELHSRGLVELFEAIDERAALHSHTPSILNDVRIGFEYLRCHLELQMNRVTRGPAPVDRQILSWLNS